MDKMYVIVRKDLSTAYRCVQGAHALAQYAFEYPRSFKAWNNEILIFLELPTLISMKSFEKKLKDNGIQFTQFREPDLDNQLTALSFRSIHMNEYIEYLVRTLPLTY